jgi:hypothetical protein
MKKIKVIAFVFAAGAGLATMAHAQETPEPCMADAEKLCHGVPMGGGQQLACLKAHKSELSPACKSKIMKAVEKHEKAPAPPPAP